MSSDFDPMPEPVDFGPNVSEYQSALAAWEARNPRISPDMAKQAMVADLEQWWMDCAENEASQVVAKAVEYGANSMVEVGHQMAKMQGRTVTDAEATEMACYFYLVGKMGRWSDALARGELVSDDTLHDIGVYVRMTQRVRSNGGWPGQIKRNPELEDIT